MPHHTLRPRQAKIIATLGPSSSDVATIERMALAGADVFRLNFSHGSHAGHAQRLQAIRKVEATLGRPLCVLVDLQGPKLRIGHFEGGCVVLHEGASFRLDSRTELPGGPGRVALPHPEVFDALRPGVDLLLDDGRIRLTVQAVGPGQADTVVVAGGTLSDRKGVNVPGVALPLSAMTPKDHEDLTFALPLGVDWVALSFVQRAEDVALAKALIAGRAGVIAKLEKPAAIEELDAIIEASDAVMVARGDLGVELPAEQVPGLQKRIVKRCRHAGKPVIVATQMLESMVAAPVLTRAEASDVATAIYDGADAVMLSAESASGRFPVEAVAMMNRIIMQTEADPAYRAAIDASHTPPPAHSANAIGWAARTVAGLLDVSGVVAYTSSGASALRVARERPLAPILGLTPQVQTAHRLCLAWGVQPKVSPDIRSVQEMTELALHTVAALQPTPTGQAVVIVAGMPFGVPGSTNLLRIARTDDRSPRANPGDLEPVVNDGLPADPDLVRTTA